MAERGRGIGRGISYVDQEEPAFLKRFKEQAGYKEEPGLEAKRHRMRPDDLDDDDDDERSENEEEKPQVIVLRAGDLTADEADVYTTELNRAKDETPANLQERVIFKKPVKRAVEEDTTSSSQTLKSSKKSKSGDSDKGGKSSEDSAAKKISNKKLLTFDDCDNDDDTG